MSAYVRQVLDNAIDNKTPGECHRIISGLLEFEKLTIEDINFVFEHGGQSVMPLILKHPLITMDWLLEHPNVYSDEIHWNPNVNADTIGKYPNFGWNWQYMHLLSDLNLNFILAHMNEDWDWEMLSMVVSFDCYLALNLEAILDIDTINMCHYRLSSNPKITIHDVINHPEFEWCEKELMENKNVKEDITLDLILAQINENDLFVRILKRFLSDCAITNELVEKMRQLPAELNASSWFFEENRNYINFKVENMSYLMPADIDHYILKYVPMKTINEKIGKFYEKCETEIANVVVSCVDQGNETNFGLRQKIRKYL